MPRAYSSLGLKMISANGLNLSIFSLLRDELPFEVRSHQDPSEFAKDNVSVIIEGCSNAQIRERVAAIRAVNQTAQIVVVVPVCSEYGRVEAIASGVSVYLAESQPRRVLTAVFAVCLASSPEALRPVPCRVLRQ